MRDRNPDDTAGKLSRNAYDTTKDQPRQTILWQDLDKLFADYVGQTLRMLDAGGGEGQTATLMAQWDHYVVLCDLSAEMAARAQRAAEEQSVSGNTHFICRVAQDIPQYLDSQVDLILFHAVLEWVADPQAILETLWSMLRPGGALSLMFYNVNGLLVRNVLASNFGYVQQGMYKEKRHTLPPDSLCGPQQVYG